MLYQYEEKFVPVDLEQWNEEKMTVGFVSVDELKKSYQKFNFRSATVCECEMSKENFRRDLEVYDDYSFGMLNVLESDNIFAHSDRIAFYIKKNLFLMVESRDQDGSIRGIFEESIKYFEDKSVTLEKFVYHVFSKLIEGHVDMLMALQEVIDDMEEMVIDRKADRDFNKRIMLQKKQLLRLRCYYEQLIGVGEDLQENENNLFYDEDLRYFHILTDRAIRLDENASLLRESLAQVREVYQSTLDYELNRIMKVFTVVTTIFLPLSLIVGWYGMNFAGMPELKWRFGYLGVIGLSISVVVICILFFKRKKFL